MADSPPGFVATTAESFPDLVVTMAESSPNHVVKWAKFPPELIGFVPESLNTAMHRFPGLINNINNMSAPLREEDKLYRQAVARAENPERLPDRLVLYADASYTWRLVNGERHCRVGIAVAWQEKVNGTLVWREATRVGDKEHFLHRYSDRCEFEAVSFGVADVAFELVCKRGPYKTVVLYTDCVNALDFIQHPIRFKGDDPFDTAWTSLARMNIAARRMQKLHGVQQMELKWLPRSLSTIGVPGQIWADCWARLTTGANIATMMMWEREGEPDESQHHWHWFASRLSLEERDGKAKEKRERQNKV